MTLTCSGEVLDTLCPVWYALICAWRIRPGADGASAGDAPEQLKSGKQQRKAQIVMPSEHDL
jgi:hypothetical protein